MKQDGFVRSVGYSSGQFLRQAGEGECVWPWAQAGRACARLCWLCTAALFVLGVPFSCTELEHSLAFVTAKTLKNVTGPQARRQMKKRTVKRWVSMYLLSYVGKGSSFRNVPSTMECWCVVGSESWLPFGNPENVTFAWS